MQGAQQKMLSFESEQSLGSTGDALFLEIRHRILTAQYAPRQLVDARNLAAASGVPKSLALGVIQALGDHGYLTPQTPETARVVHWTRQQFEDRRDRQGAVRAARKRPSLSSQAACRRGRGG